MGRVPHSTDDLADAELELQRALLAADADALEALLDDEVVLVGPGDFASTKDEELEAYRSGARRVHGFAVERSRVRVLEELGLTFTTALVEGVEAGTPFGARVRFTRTWRLGEAWTLVASHASLARE